jgi:hypothetical protein
MVDRERVLTILRRRFPSARPEDIAAAANAIVGLEDEWEELEWRTEFRLLVRRGSREQILAPR